MAKRVTKEGRIDRRFKTAAPGFQQQVQQQGGGPAVQHHLGEMPLTLWLIVAAIILYLYIRRSLKGIDTHPGERAEALVRAPQPRVSVGGTVPFQTLPFTPPPVPGAPGGPQIIIVPDRSPAGGLLQ